MKIRVVVKILYNKFILFVLFFVYHDAQSYID
jgi:hypothetical protein